MKYPKIKHALLCRILTYVVVIGAFAVPVIVVASIKPIPESVKLAVGVAFCIGLIIYLFSNLFVLMGMDMCFAMHYCHDTARKSYDLPQGRRIDAIEKSISHFGTRCKPAPIAPQPADLRYKFRSPMTIYSCGIERIIATYHTDLLTAETYRAIFTSALANSKVLRGRKKALFLDSNQKTAPLNRVTVIVIFASSVDASLKDKLYDLVCKQEGDGFDEAVVPCVIDMSSNTCVFNSKRVPYTGMTAYPAKTRGYNLVKKYVFGGNLNLKNNTHFLEPMEDYAPEQSLWDFWRGFKNDMDIFDRKNKKRFESMTHKQIIFEVAYLYIKWEDKGMCLFVDIDEEKKTATVDAIHTWDYPKANKIAKATVKEMEGLIKVHFFQMGYSAEFVSMDEE